MPSAEPRQEKIKAGGIIVTATRVWFANLLPFSAIALLFNLPLIVWCYTSTKVQAPGEFATALHNYTLASGFLTFITGGLVCAAVSHGTLQHLRGTSVSVKESMRVGAKQAVTAFLITFLTTLFAGFAMLALIFPGVIVAIMYAVAVPVAVSEGLGFKASMRRSRALTDGLRKPVLLTLLFIVAMHFGFTYLVQLFLGIGKLDLTAPFQTSESQIAVMKHTHNWLPISTAIIQMLTAVSSVVPAVLYAELRRAKEGQDTAAIAPARVV
jgi:hypothetical protein